MPKGASRSTWSHNGERFLRRLSTYPRTLVLEALLQTGGVLARAATGFTRMSVLGKIERAEFPGDARAGDRIELDVSVVLSRPEGTLCEGTASVDGRAVARAEFMIVFVPEEARPPPDPARAARQRAHMRAIRVPSEEE